MGNTSEAPTLDVALIADYEARLHQQGVPLDACHTAGLTRDEMDEIVGPLAISLPQEARTWWTWQNGCPGYGRGKLIAPIGESLLTLTQAVTVSTEYRTAVVALVEPDVPALANADDRWHPSWLAITGPQLPIVIDCSHPESEQTPVKRFDPEDVEGAREIHALSLGQMLTWWIGAIDSGAWCWNTETEKWIVDPRRLALEFKLSGLA
jgi:hypothetical protein